MVHDTLLFFLHSSYSPIPGHRRRNYEQNPKTVELEAIHACSFQRSSSVDNLFSQNIVENCCKQQKHLAVHSIVSAGHEEFRRLTTRLRNKCRRLAACVKNCILTELYEDADLYFSLR
ncbi:hypothetical protein RF11_00421 [Thelohanellus kitauei]|uniref:Uncharacterized protein n=1 Tax=Thelohanellus kitauei TaxID=669202 RepID=A0A0C2MQM6_THEKT|nr:hypothetical protein RF11_00421 [Thelohanellus kitauei]